MQKKTIWNNNQTDNTIFDKITTALIKQIEDNKVGCIVEEDSYGNILNIITKEYIDNFKAQIAKSKDFCELFISNSHIMKLQVTQSTITISTFKKVKENLPAIVYYKLFTNKSGIKKEYLEDITLNLENMENMQTEPPEELPEELHEELPEELPENSDKQEKAVEVNVEKEKSPNNRDSRNNFNSGNRNNQTNHQIDNQNYHKDNQTNHQVDNQNYHKDNQANHQLDNQNYQNNPKNNSFNRQDSKQQSSNQRYKQKMEEENKRRKRMNEEEIKKENAMNKNSHIPQKTQNPTSIPDDFSSQEQNPNSIPDDNFSDLNDMALSLGSLDID